MYGKRIRYYRIKNGLTVDELANKLNLTKAAISQYENDKRDPDDKTLSKIADIFNISWLKLVPTNDNNLNFVHYSFRKKMSVSDNSINVLKEDIELMCKNEIDMMNLLGTIPEKPFEAKKLDDNNSIENNVKEIRKALKVSLNGPIYSITNSLEKIGVIVLTFDCDDAIEGLNGTVNKIPYIFFNSNRTIERQRFTLIHEFCHLFFNHLNKNDSDFEKYINKLAGHVLITDEDLFNEFGKTNRNLNSYLRNSVAREYKIAPSCLITRLFESNVITKLYYQNFFKFLNAGVGKKNEKTLLNQCFDNELPTRFTQQVYRALDDELITKSRAAELLNISLVELMKNIVEG